MTKTMRGRGRRWLFGEDNRDKRKKKESHGKWKRKMKLKKIIEKNEKETDKNN